jgi:hypothetical protein
MLAAIPVRHFPPHLPQVRPQLPEHPRCRHAELSTILTRLGGRSCSERRVRCLADGVEARVAQASERVERLRQALLAKEFRGELVLRDPNDEPAEALSGASCCRRQVHPHEYRFDNLRSKATGDRDILQG